MECNICQSITETPGYYWIDVGFDGTIKNIDQNPELQYTSIDFAVNDGYRAWIMKSPTYHYFIDCS